MITTRQVNVQLDKGRSKLVNVTTKTVDPSSKGKDRPEGKRKGILTRSPIVTTQKMADIEAIKEKKKRDEIIAQRKKQGRPQPEEEAAQPKTKLVNLDRSFQMRHMVVEIDELVQAISRRELK